MLKQLNDVHDMYVKLQHQKYEYEMTLRKIEGMKNPPDFVINILNKYIPHRSCPNCFEDCIGWVVDGQPCNGRESE